MAKHPTTHESGEKTPPAVKASPPIDENGKFSKDPTSPWAKRNADLKINACYPYGTAPPPNADPKDGVTPFAPAGNQAAFTVTCENPTPPTNLVCCQQYPPTTFTQAQAQVAGRPWPNFATSNVFAVPTVGTYIPEGSGTETAVNFPGATNDYRVSAGAIQGVTLGSDGAYTTTPNTSHASYPGTPTLTAATFGSSVHGTGLTTLATLTGTNFQSTSQIFINGVAAAPPGAGYVSETSMTPTVSIPIAAGTYAVTVVTPGQPVTSSQNWVVT